MVDNSGSITYDNGLTKIRSAVEVLNTLRKPNDEIGLVLFGDVKNVRSVRDPYPYDLSADNLATIDGQDNITALWLGVQKGLEVSNHCQSRERYLIVLTDGRDNSNFGDPFKAARDFGTMAQQQGTNICVVGIQSDQLDEGPLYLLATGCKYFQAASLSQPSGGDLLAGQFQEIVGYVRDFYRLEIPPEYFNKGQQLYVQLTINDTFIMEKQLTLDVSP